MTKEELELLKVELSPLNLNTPTPLITEFGFKNNKEDAFCIKIGKASYYNFAEAQALLNDLERHIK